MKILFVTRKYPPKVGGMELFAYELSTALESKVDLKLIKWGHSQAWLPIVLPLLWTRAIWVLLTQKVDVIHVHDGLQSPIAWLVAKVFRKPYIVVIHGRDMTFKFPPYQWLVPKTVKAADRVVCVSRAAAEVCLERGISENKISVINLGIKDKYYQPGGKAEALDKLNLNRDGRPVLLTVGRLVKRKGVSWFVDNVLPSLVDRYPELIYLVIGEGDDKDSIKRAVQRHQLDNNVFLLGRAPDDVLASAYNTADLFIMPNIKVPGSIEGFGLVSLEAAVCALPVIASNLEGIKDAIVSGDNGILVQTQAAQQFKEAIEKFISNPKQAEAFGLKARAYTLENYSWAKVAERFIQVYRDVT